MFDNIDIDDSSNDFGITADSPTAHVSQVGQHYSVIGGDNGQTVYASGIPQESTAVLVAEKINEMRDGAEYDTNAERLSDDPNVVFAITREDGPALNEALKQFFIGVTIAVLISALYEAYSRVAAFFGGDDR